MLPGIDLHVKGRITAADAHRQSETAKEILRRFDERPGLILADEVGMGKTFVSLAVAASVALQDPKGRPVVVMVPSGLKEKWPRDFKTFAEMCVTPDLRQGMRCAVAENGVDFLKHLDDPDDRRPQVVFLTHGAMQRAMNDEWVRLAVIRQALHRRHDTDDLRRSLGQRLGRLIRGFGSVNRQDSDIWERLLASHPEEWARLLKRAGLLEENADDPVPRHLIDALERIETGGVYAAVQSIPLRDSENHDERLRQARKEIYGAIHELWGHCLHAMHLHLPLLILDEAHHLKNAHTKLASLFHSDTEDSETQAVRPKGSLGGVFERMLFLTATPFQLGHHELCSVVDRFDGIDWNHGPRLVRKEYGDEKRELRAKLDRAEASALVLNDTWGRLTLGDLVADGLAYSDPDTWWLAAKEAKELPGLGRQVVDAVNRTKAAFDEAEAALRPWVIRHLRSKTLQVGSEPTIERRRPFVGAGIVADDDAASEGLPVEGPALLPFLLAARATLCRPDKRPVFAEGLASSYEAFLHTREKPEDALDEDDSAAEDVDPARDRAAWYLEQLTEHLPLGSHRDTASHPKIAATVNRVIDAWKSGEKIVVFCHYVKTGYALRRAISGRIREFIAAEAGRKLAMEPEAAFAELEDLGLRFFDKRTNARSEIIHRVDGLLGRFAELTPHREVLQEVVRRFLRTPSFLVRFYPLGETRQLTPETVRMSFASRDASGLSLEDMLSHFFEFLAKRCSEEERKSILAAVDSMQTGGISAKDAQDSMLPDEVDVESNRPEQTLPNVRLVNGRTKGETRQRLMLTFNSPFFPEVLIASAVMAEGVDLHRFCRYVIHHDLCWNPSVLEQRTGRIDRIGAKVETTGRPIHLYKPFLGATQDERQYRVVSDRERWFNIVMGAKYTEDAASTERQATRIPLAAAICEDLKFRLEVV
jgi:superfamily II DNA or RNA helicase